MAETTAAGGFQKKDRVVAAHDLPGVPEGTAGRIMTVTGLSWTRYRVRFENGVDVGVLDARHLAPASGKR